MAVFIAILANRVVAAIMVYLIWWVILPLTLVAIQGMLPQWLATPISWANGLSPIVLMAQATSVFTLSTRGPVSLLEGIAGLGLWTMALGLLALFVFRRRSI